MEQQFRIAPSRTVIWNGSKCSVVVASTRWHRNLRSTYGSECCRPLDWNLSHKQNMIKPQNSLSLNHMMMWTSLVTLVNSLDVGHMVMWPVSVNHMVMWTRLLTLVQVGDCWKYALEAIINGYYYISLFMIIVYCSCYNCIIRNRNTCVNT